MTRVAKVRAALDETILRYLSGAPSGMDVAASLAPQLSGALSRVERLEKALKKARDAANTPWSGYSTYQIPVDNEELENLRACARAVRDAFECSALASPDATE